MGERQEFQPLTREDRVSVAIYRTGIVLSTVLIAVLASYMGIENPVASRVADGLALGLYVSVGMSVFFIHLYIGKLKVFLKNLYYISLVCLALLLYLGKGSVAIEILHQPASALLLLPLSGCLGFVTAKEAFCFRLVEGYLLAMIMPIYLLLIAAEALTCRVAFGGMVLIALMLVVFTLRKVFMPAAWDIGDKTAYR